MESILSNPQFAERYQQLALVTLNPRRHTAPHARAHAEAVAARAGDLADANGCAPAERQLLVDLGHAHDIGKIDGTARPEQSLAVLRACGVDAPALTALVKWHDTSLPWYLAHAKGQAPSDKAWRRLAAEVDLRLLALFMVADRVDAPPGWRRNAPTGWFLDEARRRGLIPALVLDLPGVPSTVSAGGAVVRTGAGAPAVLVIRIRAHGFELPKGGIEWDELPADAAVREAREEAGLVGALEVGRELGHLTYTIDDAGARYAKRVRYFAIDAGAGALGELPARTHERRWIDAAMLDGLPLIDEALRPILRAALAP
jgi:8-oxo-dGTP pyrophosphatase MutT (NUDIX family)